MTPQVQRGRGQAEGPTGREVGGASSEYGSLEAPGAGTAGEAMWGPGPDDSVKAGPERPYHKPRAIHKQSDFMRLSHF